MHKYELGMMVLVAAVTAGCGASGNKAAAQGGGVPAPIELRLLDFAFAPQGVTAKSGDVTVHVTNAGATEHNVAIQSNGKTVAELAVVAVGKSETLKASLKPGAYTLVCTYPGHKDAGMVGTLKVE